MITEFQLPPGTVVAGDYRVVRLIAEGGMGAVYLVEQVSTGRLRAFKVLHPRFVREATMRERFVQEARVASKIASDHVVEVVSAGIEEQSGIPWMVMEYLEGDTLDKAVEKRGRLTHDETREVFSQLGHALAAAHAVGIVHRDLKPENVILAQSHRVGNAFTVKVLDFGIAKIVQDSYSGNTQAMGTPLWMAPEQTVAGERIGTATDVWALGLMAFYMLTGKVYWRMANSPDGGGMSVLRELMIDRIASPFERSAELGVPDTLPPGFDVWFARCVDRDIARRFRHAGEATEGLLALFRTETGLAPTASIPMFSSPSLPAQPSGNALRPVSVYGPPAALHTPPATAQPSAPWTNPSSSSPNATPWGSALPGATQASNPDPSWQSGPGVHLPAAPAAAAPRHRSSKPLIVALALGALLSLGTVAFAGWYYLSEDPDPAPTTHVPAPDPPPPPPPPRVPEVPPAPPPPPAPLVVMNPIEAPPPPPPPPEAPVAPQPPPEGNPFALHSLWRGRYECAQGPTAASLRIDAVRGDLVSGSFLFTAPQSSINGEYRVSGRWEERLRRLVLRPGAWVVHPSGWTSVGLDGRVSQDSSTYAGQMLHPQCSSFALRAAP